jgi:hypothetical protein
MNTKKNNQLLISLIQSSSYLLKLAAQDVPQTPVSKNSKRHEMNSIITAIKYESKRLRKI